MLSHLEDEFYSITCDKATVDALFDRSSHANGSEVVKVEMTNITTGSRIMGYGN